MSTTTRRMTIEELERDGPPEGRWELIDGELVAMPPAGEEHGHIWGAIHFQLWGFVAPRQFGRVFGADTGFVVSSDPQVVRVPDVGFVRAERLAPDRDQKQFLRVVPDLVVEVISPWDRAGEVLAKVLMWLDAGTTLVWLVDPAAATVTVFEHDAMPRILGSEDSLDGGEVLPGFTLAIRDIFIA